MIGYLLGRIAAYLATIVSSAIAIFLAIDLLPTSAAAAPISQIHLRFWHWAQALAHGDLGITLRNEPVAGLLAPALLTTLALLGLTLLLAIIFGAAIGLRAGAGRGGALSSGTAQILVAIPVVVVGTALAAVLALLALPADGAISAKGANALIPLAAAALAAAVPTAGFLALCVRDAARKVAHAPFIRMVQARGQTSRQALRRVGARAVLVRVLAHLGPHLPWLVATLFAAEIVFSLPGLSAVVTAGVVDRDVAVLRVGVLALVVLAASAHLVVDLLRALIDPQPAAEPK